MSPGKNFTFEATSSEGHASLARVHENSHRDGSEIEDFASWTWGLCSIHDCGGPQPLAGEQVTGVPVRSYALIPVTLELGLHGHQWYPPRATTDFGGDWER